MSAQRGRLKVSDLAGGEILIRHVQDHDKALRQLPNLRSAKYQGGTQQCVARRIHIDHRACLYDSYAHWETASAGMVATTYSAAREERFGASSIFDILRPSKLQRWRHHRLG
jgi:hypothetical protein